MTSWFRITVRAHGQELSLFSFKTDTGVIVNSSRDLKLEVWDEQESNMFRSGTLYTIFDRSRTTFRFLAILHTSERRSRMTCETRSSEQSTNTMVEANAHSVQGELCKHVRTSAASCIDVHECGIKVCGNIPVLGKNASGICWFSEN